MLVALGAAFLLSSLLLEFDFDKKRLFAYCVAGFHVQMIKLVVIMISTLIYSISTKKKEGLKNLAQA